MRSPVGAAPRAPRLLVALLGLLLAAPAPAVLLAPAATAVEPFVLSGTVSDPDAEPLVGVTVSVLPAGGGSAVATGTSQLVDDEAVYAVRVPAGSYWLSFGKTGYATAYLENDADDDPATVDVDAAGRVTSSGVELEDGLLPDVSLLLTAPTVQQAPRLSGEAAVGRTLTVSTGSWSGITVDTDYVTVEWFIGGVVADEYSDGAWWQRFEVPLEAVGAKVGFRLTVEDPEGARADAVYEDSSAVVPRPVSSVAAAVRKTRLTAVVTVPGVPRPVGTVSVTDGSRSMGRARLTARSKGKVVVKLRKLKPGRHRLTVAYAGPAAIVASKTVVRVKVPRR
ncbi:carboxypeptidase-like regulatory domain-containing protein [Nocardioides soli]|uniref:Bacterial Ig-like domain-containing protein n=1 Tax=Nocardioides soli TaxID=1036020 RepID=A0A7W4VWA5_9ACTN|nr:carboxypeptidase-like regulatory domain-containing protein [Nocardioides soli]MBB3042584.1 hypothetical protein [Nocardioides soli]